MVKSKNTFIELTLFLFLLALAVVLSLGKNFTSAVSDGIKLFASCVLPALFPYFFITAILSSLSVTGKISLRLSPLTTRLFNVNGTAGYALFMSLICGYPTGAKIVSDLKDKNLLSDTESIRAAALCSSSSPMFTIGSVGNLMFNSQIFGALLFLTHLFAVLTTGFIFSFYKKSSTPKNTRKVLPLNAKKVDNVLYESAYSAVISVLVVGALITVFYLLTEVLLTFNILNPPIKILSIFFDETVAKSIAVGFFEYTRGLKILSENGITLLSLPVAAFLTGFSGLSVIAQSIAYLKKAKIKTAPFFLSKLSTAVFGFLFGLLFSLFATI